MSNNQRVKAILGSLFLMFALVLASCAPGVLPAEAAAVRAWVGGPPDGSEVHVGLISAMCHGYARVGVAHLELWVNGAFSNRAGNPDPAAQYFTNSLNFETTEPGSYVLHCRTYAQDGEWAQSAPVTVRVPGEPVPPTATQEIPTATPTSTGVPTDTPTATGVPTDTPTATGVPTDTPTATPTSTLTPTPQPVRIISFEADHTQIVAGECVRFTWQVEAPTAIFFDGEGVGNYPDYRDRCPPSTRSFELRAEGSGGPDIESITIVVVQPSPSPSDREGPNIYREAGPNVMAEPMPPSYCTSPYEFSATVVDPSGVRWVKLICSFNQGPELSCGGLQYIGSNFYRINYALPTDGSISQGDTMHWRIRACDMVDPMNCTDSPTHNVPIGACVI